MKKTFTERNLVVILFVMVLVTFSFAQQDSKKIEKLYLGFKINSENPVTPLDNAKASDYNQADFNTQYGSKVD